MDLAKGRIVRHSSLIKNRRGYTVAELLVASAVLVSLIIGMFLIVDALRNTYGRGESRADLQQSARIAMARIVRELRAAGFDPDALIPRLSMPTAIQTAEANRIAFIGDPDGDGRSKKIEYRLDLSADTPILRRQQWTTWNGGWSGNSGAQPFAEGITAIELTYYGADGAAIPLSAFPARAGEIRRVGLTIAAASPPSHTPPETYRLVGEVQLRNVGS